MALSMALYRACFICGRRCPWWSRQLRLTLLVISDIKPIIYSFCLHVYILVYCSLPPTLPLHWPTSRLCHLNCLASLPLLSFVDLSLQVCCSFSPLPPRGGILLLGLLFLSATPFAYRDPEFCINHSTWALLFIFQLVLSADQRMRLPPQVRLDLSLSLLLLLAGDASLNPGPGVRNL